MKVTGSTASSSAKSSARPQSAGAGFTVGTPASATATTANASAASVNGIAGVSSLMALQGVEDVGERRRRAIRRGRGLLDRLDELKLALLDGAEDRPVLESLSRAVREERSDADDPGLKALLDQIDLRAAVELAKADLRRSAA